jgi:hypothetical protein
MAVRGVVWREEVRIVSLAIEAARASGVLSKITGELL